MRKGLFGVAFLLFLAGCAGAEVTETRLDLGDGVLTKATPILIEQADASHTIFRGDYSDDPPSVAASRMTLSKTFAPKAVAA
jgi:hypothetical protein